MLNQFSRTELLIGKEALTKLSNSRVLLFGLGGVGGYVAEALTRCGLGSLDIVDNDVVDITNLNRQIISLHSNLGMNKTDVTEKRLKDINPDIKITKYKMFYMPDKAYEFNFGQYDYVIDAIDTVSAKLSIIENAKKNNIPVISSMGTGNKLNPTKFEIADISKTSVCPLARVIRGELKKRRIFNVKVLYSKETPLKQSSENRKSPASNSIVPPVAGLLIANEVIKDLIK